MLRGTGSLSILYSGCCIVPPLLPEIRDLVVRNHLQVSKPGRMVWDSELAQRFAIGTIVRKLKAIQGVKLVRRELDRTVIVQSFHLGNFHDLMRMVGQLAELDDDLNGTGDHFLDGSCG